MDSFLRSGRIISRQVPQGRRDAGPAPRPSAESHASGAEPSGAVEQQAVDSPAPVEKAEGVDTDEELVMENFPLPPKVGSAEEIAQFSFLQPLYDDCLLYTSDAADD